MGNRFTRLALILFVGVVLAACGNRNEVQKSAGQVVAKVNGDEISVHQLNAVLGQVQGSGGDVKVLGGQLLERLIDQQILVRQALDKKLDRNPQVLQQLEAARREVLVRAFSESLGGPMTPADPIAVRDFYKDHPDLFAKRRIYNLVELTLRPKPEQLEAVKTQVAAATQLDDFVSWLKAQNVPFSSNNGRKAAEQLPIELLPRFAALKEGEIAFFGDGAGLNVIQMQSFEEAPVSEADATPVIQQFIAARKRNELVRGELKRLRETAKIEYLGEFNPPAVVAQGKQ